MNLTCKQTKIASDVTAPLRVTRGIERTFPRPFSETFRISKNEDFNGPYLENENEFLKNSFETVFRASKSCDRDQLASAFQLTFMHERTEDFFKKSITLSPIPPPHTLPPTCMAVHYRLLLFYLMLSLCQ